MVVLLQSPRGPLIHSKATDPPTLTLRSPHTTTRLAQKKTHLDAGLLVEETRIVVDQSGLLRSVQEIHQHEKLLQLEGLQSVFEAAFVRERNGGVGVLVSDVWAVEKPGTKKAHH